MKYFKEVGDKIVCLLCRHYCHLRDGQIGVCGVNQNLNSKLENLVYNHPSTIHIDPIEKKPLFHFLPNTTTLSFGSVGCNFKCPFCQNWTISQTHNIDKSVVVTPEQMVDLAIEYGANSISYTYNEPTIFYPYAKDIGIIAREKGLKNVFVSNGFLSNEVCEDIVSFLDGANIDLKSFDKNYYKRELKGDLNGVLETIKKLYDAGVWIEITTLIIDGINSDEVQLREIAEFIASISHTIPWHLSSFHPDYKMKDTKPTKLKSLMTGYNIGKEIGLKYIYLGNVPVPQESHCSECGTLLLLRDRFNTKINNLKDGMCYKCGSKFDGIF